MKKQFANVQKLEYADALKVTNIEDIVEYIDSLSCMSALSRHKKRRNKTNA